MFLSSHLRLSRHGVYYFRLVLPVGLREAFGKREIIHSLRTKCPRVAKLAAGVLSSRLAINRAQGLSSLEKAIKEMRPQNVMELKFGAIRLRDGTELRDVSISDDPALQGQDLEALSALINRHGGPDASGQVQSANEPAPTNSQTAPKIPARPKSLEDAWNSYLATKRDAAVSTKEGYTESFNLFAELLGGTQRQVHEITDSEVLEFYETLAHIPQHAKKRNIRIGTIAQLNEHLPKYINTDEKLVDVDVISDNTADQHVVRIRSFLTWTTKAQHRIGDNPLEGLGYSPNGKRKRALPFLDHELMSILDPASFMSAKRPTQYWSILISLYTGARLNEIACLEIKDIIEEQGVRCFSILEEEEDSYEQVEKTKIRSKRTKNSTSIRLVPIHPDLFDLGLNDYIEDLKSLGTDLLFPNAPLDQKGKRERRLSHDGNEYLKLVGVHQSRTKVMHSFRSVVINRLEHSELKEYASDRWTGHQTQSVKANHYLVPSDMPEFAKKGLAALKFPQVDKEKLRYRKGWWNAYIQESLKKS